jgi:hypothetical protein
MYIHAACSLARFCLQIGTLADGSAPLTRSEGSSKVGDCHKVGGGSNCSAPVWRKCASSFSFLGLAHYSVYYDDKRAVYDDIC